MDLYRSRVHSDNIATRPGLATFPIPTRSSFTEVIQRDLLSDSEIYQQLRDWQSSFETNNPCQGKTRYGPIGMAAAANPKTVPQ